MIRITKPGGLICFTVNEGVWEPGDFATAIKAHVEAQTRQILEQEKRDYMVNEGVQAWYITAQKRQKR